MRKILPLLLVALLAAARHAAAAPAGASGAGGDPLDAEFRTRLINQVAISPDGRVLAFVLPEPVPDGDGVSRWRIFFGKTAAGEPERMTPEAAGPAAFSEKEVHWSPDGTKIAFLSDREKPGQLQLWVRPIGGAARQLTHLNGVPTRPRWSPDGRTLSLLFAANVDGVVGAGSAGRPLAGEVAYDSYVQNIILVDASTGATRTITPPAQYAYEYDWAPDSREIAYTAAPAPGDNLWYHARLYAVSAQDGAVREIYRPAIQIAAPRWSPDGRTIAFIGGVMSDKGSTGGDIWTVPAAGGGEATDLTAGRKSSPTWVKWLPHKRQLLFSEFLDGGTAVSTLDLATGRFTRLWQDLGMIGCGEDHFSPKVVDVLELSVAGDETTSAVVRSSPSHPPEVWVGPLGQWTRRTEINRGIVAPWGKVENVHWKSDEWTVQGTLVYPSDYTPGRRYPLIVSVHGGPANQKAVCWPVATSFDLSLFAARGYFVFCPNPRGSYGQGEAFTHANVKDYGFGPFRDMMAGVDAVLKAHPEIDPGRVGIAGESYGGFMTMWAVTQTRRFRAAISTSGMCDFQAEYGQTWVDQWMPIYLGATAYDDPAAYDRVSPIRYIKNAATPTLIFAGAGDKECPAAQSLEFWHALKALGVPTELYIFTGEGHSPRRHANILDRMGRVEAWFDRYLR